MRSGQLCAITFGFVIKLILIVFTLALVSIPASFALAVSEVPPTAAKLSPNDIAFQLSSEQQIKGLIPPTFIESSPIFTTYMPILITPPHILNGDFELGRFGSPLVIGAQGIGSPLVIDAQGIGPASANPPVNWNRYSLIGYELFFTQSSEPLKLPIPAQSGIWATWLGGDDYEISYIQQQVTVPRTNPFLIFSYWIQSYDSFCGTDLYTVDELLSDFISPSPEGGLIVDIGGVVIDDNSGIVGVVATDLCTNTETNGWDSVIINLSEYAGETVSIQIRSKGDIILTSSFFIDNVNLGGTSLTTTSTFSELQFVPRPAPLSGGVIQSSLTDQSAAKLLLIAPTETGSLTKKGNIIQTPLSSGK